MTFDPRDLTVFAPADGGVELRLGLMAAGALADALVEMLPALGQCLKDDCEATIVKPGEEDYDLADIARKAWELSIVAGIAAAVRGCAEVAAQDVLDEVGL